MVKIGKANFNETSQKVLLENLVTQRTAELQKSQEAMLNLLEDLKEENKILRNTEKYYRTLIEKAPDGVVLIDKSGKMIYASPAARRLFGYGDNNSDDTYPDPNESTHPDDLPFVLETIQKILADPSLVSTIEYRFRTKDGNYKWVESTFSNHYNEPGIGSMVINFRDITDRKSIERGYKDRNQKLRALLDISNSLSATHDSPSLFQKIVNSIPLISQFRTSAIYTLHDDILILAATYPELPPGFPDKFRNAHLTDHTYAARVLETLKPIIEVDYLNAGISEAEREIAIARNLKSLIFLPLVHKEEKLGVLIVGSIDEIRTPTDLELDIFNILAKQASIEISETRLYEEKIKYLNSLEIEIEERRKTEKALQESEAKYRSIVNSSPNGMYFYILDHNGDLILTGANPAADRIIGIEHKSLIGKTITEAFPKLKNSNVPEMYRQIAEGVLKNQMFEIEYHEDQINGYFEVSAFNSGIRTITVEFSDISESKANEREIKKLNAELEKRVEERTSQLFEANKELEAFAYSISHDLRTPLRAINGFANILEQEYANQLDDEGKRICSIISGNALKLGNLVDGLLNFSRLSRTDLNKVQTDMRSMVVEVCDEIAEPVMKEKIVFEISENLHSAKADPLLIRQVWVNYLSNAIKFSLRNSNPVIRVESKPENGKIIYSVSDNGTGFDMQYADKLFRVFQRLHTDKEYEGTGIGLALAQRIVQRHNGKTWATSEPGKGATFFFSLPAK